MAARESTPAARKRGGQPKPPELRRVSLTMRVLPTLREKALRLGRPALERLIAGAKEPTRQACQPTKCAAKARG